MIVEGDAELLLLPVIAKLIGKPLEKNGVSIVNVGHVGLFRYARIFQRKDDSFMGVRVACLTDLDIPSPDATDYLHRNKDGNHTKTHADLQQSEIDLKRFQKIQRASGGCVTTCVSPYWTLEHDLCWNNAQLSVLIHQAILLARASDSLSNELTLNQIIKIKNKAQNDITNWATKGLTQSQVSAEIYKPLYLKRASKVSTAYYLCELLTEEFKNSDATLNRALFPSYLLDALDYVTASE